jgi:tetratricopeptide (TPR) repeat protein
MVDSLAEYEAIRLFTERATLALSSFSLTEANVQSVVEICRKVDGIPLAIELAAARVDILQVDEILKQLHQSFALLASESKVILPRQQTLQASMDWSWGLLSEAEKIFLQQLSVFAGGWTLESAQTVCDGEVLPLTSALVKKSLIVVDQEARRETRYHFHEIVRQYVHGKFTETGPGEQIYTRHLHYFLNLSERAQTELRGPARVDWMERLNDERNNLRAALHWADQTNTEAGLYLAARLRRYWESSNLREGIHWLENFLSRPGSNDFPLARAHALHTYGWLLTWLQQFDKARSVTEESLALFRTAGDLQTEADALVSLGNIKQFLYEPDSALKLFQQSLTLAHSLNDPWREANAYFFLGWDRRDFQGAMSFWEKALSLYRKTGDQIAVANLLGMLGQFRVLNGDIELGETYIDEALLLWKTNHRANIWQNPRIVKSLVALTRGDYEQAYTLLEEALLAARETGNRMSYLWVRVRQGYAALRLGRLEEARSVFMETAHDFHKDGYTIGTVFALEGMAALYAAVGKLELAAHLIGLADATRENVKDARPPLEQADVDQIIAACLAKMGEVAFSDAYEKGQKMTLEETVNLALAES